MGNARAAKQVNNIIAEISKGRNVAGARGPSQTPKYVGNYFLNEARQRDERK
jgi:hypothetical protein